MIPDKNNSRMSQREYDSIVDAVNAEEESRATESALYKKLYGETPPPVTWIDPNLKPKTPEEAETEKAGLLAKHEARIKRYGSLRESERKSGIQGGEMSMPGEPHSLILKKKGSGSLKALRIRGISEKGVRGFVHLKQSVEIATRVLISNREIDRSTPVSVMSLSF